MKRFFAEKTVLLGVCGSVAAYKACEIASRLREHGARVHCALTRSAGELIRPASFEAITGNNAITGMFAPLTNPDIEHIAMARKADLFLIAPATANMIAKAAHGIADDWLSTTLLATRAPILFAPAMNAAMYSHPATQANIALLRERGALFVGPAAGRLACGEEGTGRLADTTDILDRAAMALHQPKDFTGLRVLITSGPNREPIDAARFLGNRSSGKMGRALALEALCRGASVRVVSGPAAVPPPTGAETIFVQTAAQMHQAVMDGMDNFDILIGAAAVADFRMEQPSATKIKRTGEHLLLRLIPNPDIIASVAAARRPGQRVVGFAAESHDLLQHAQEKLVRKGLDMIVANTIGGDHCAIGSDTEDAWILTVGDPPAAYRQIDKGSLAKEIFDRLSPA